MYIGYWENNLQEDIGIEIWSDNSKYFGQLDTQYPHPIQLSLTLTFFINILLTHYKKKNNKNQGNSL